MTRVSIFPGNRRQRRDYEFPKIRKEKKKSIDAPKILGKEGKRLSEPEFGHPRARSLWRNDVIRVLHPLCTCLGVIHHFRLETWKGCGIHVVGMLSHRLGIRLRISRRQQRFSQWGPMAWPTFSPLAPLEWKTWLTPFDASPLIHEQRPGAPF